MMRRGSLLFVACLLFAASDGPFTGTWESSQSGTSGTIRIRIKPEPDVVFTVGGQEVKTKVASFKNTDSGFDIDYDFTLEGYELRSSVKATLKGEELSGDYRTSVRGDGTPVDTGKFKGKVDSERRQP